MIVQKVQHAFRDYLAGLTFTTFTPAAIVAGIHAENDATNKSTPLPSITVECRSAQQDGHESAHWIAQVEIRLRENADDTDEDDHLERGSELESVLVASGIESDISNSGFTAQLVEWLEIGYEIEGRSWVSYYRCNVHCVGRELT